VVGAPARGEHARDRGPAARRRPQHLAHPGLRAAARRAFSSMGRLWQ